MPNNQNNSTPPSEEGGSTPQSPDETNATGQTVPQPDPMASISTRPSPLDIRDLISGHIQDFSRTFAQPSSWTWSEPSIPPMPVPPMPPPTPVEQAPTDGAGRWQQEAARLNEMRRLSIERRLEREMREQEVRGQILPSGPAVSRAPTRAANPYWQAPDAMEVTYRVDPDQIETYQISQGPPPRQYRSVPLRKKPARPTGEEGEQGVSDNSKIARVIHLARRARARFRSASLETNRERKAEKVQEYINFMDNVVRELPSVRHAPAFVLNAQAHRLSRIISRSEKSSMVQCQYSGSEVPRSHTIVFNDSDLVHAVYFSAGRTCPECSRFVWSNRTHPTNRGRICDPCINRVGYRRIRSGYIHPDDWDEDTHGADVQIHGHLANPLRILGEEFHTSDKDTGTPLFLGVELEVVPRRGVDKSVAVARSGRIMRNAAIIKRDGSVDAEMGFEIVSAPGTLAWQREVWTPLLEGSPALKTEAAAQYLRSWGAQVPCGLHVHIDREGLGDLAAGKVMAFVHNPNNLRFMEIMAGRSANRYVVYNPNRGDVDKLGYPVEGRTVVKHIKRGYRTHYDAAGPSERYNTIEIRIFRGNVSPHGFFRAVEFCDALARFCKGQYAMPERHDEAKVVSGLISSRPKKAPASTIGARGMLAGGNNLRAEDFLAWFSQARVRTSYPSLQDFLIRKGLITVKKKLFENYLEAA